MKNRALLAAFACATLLCGAARADDKDAVLEEARQHVAKAKVHYDLGEFKEAADEYILVYRLRPIPALLFNIAQAYRQGGLYEKARQFYKSYLREAPDAKNKTMIEQAIREVDELLAKEKKTKEAAPTGVKEAPEASLPIKPLPQPAKVAEAPKPAEAPKVAEAAKPAEPAKPAEAPKPAETSKPAETPKQVEAAKPVEPPKAVPQLPLPSPKEPQPKVADASAPAVKHAPASTPPAAQPQKPATVAMAGAPASATKAPPAAVGAQQSPPPAPKEEAPNRTLTWVLAGAGAGLLAGGGAFFLSAGKIDSELSAQPHTRAAADDLISQSKSKHLLSGVLFAAGAAALVGAGVMLVF